MNYQNEKLPKNAVKVGSTPTMNNETVVEGILCNHLAPKGKIGFLVVESGALQFIWEDEDAVLDADVDHPIVIFPERFHHVKLQGPVEFRVEFYEEKTMKVVTAKHDGLRPGESFLFNKFSKQ